jgi:hypothetical protein
MLSDGGGACFALLNNLFIIGYIYYMYRLTFVLVQYENFKKQRAIQKFITLTSKTTQTLHTCSINIGRELEYALITLDCPDGKTQAKSGRIQWRESAMFNMRQTLYYAF